MENIGNVNGLIDTLTGYYDDTSSMHIYGSLLGFYHILFA